jgi:uncharacterized coiled-coil protein SlyX
MIDRSSDASTRLDELEMRIAHQDRMMAELNESIASQWRHIDGLQREIASLREGILSIGTQRDVEPPPPHY